MRPMPPGGPSPRDISTREDIEVLVGAFYRRAFDDAELGPIFVDVARLPERLDEHLPRIVDFWESVLLKTHAYPGGAFWPHQQLHERSPLTAAHFARWVDLWTATVEEHFAGPVATSAVVSAQRFAGAFHRRLAGGSGLAIGDRPTSG